MTDRLALFDLDHTLLLGDSDVLWCDFLMDRGVLDRARFASRSADIEARYKAGTVDAAEFANFYLSTLKGRTPEQWEPLRQQFLREQIVPRIPRAAFDLVHHHQCRGDRVVLTTATNRFLTTLTADHLGIAEVIATEPDMVDGCFSGASSGVLNMREGKVIRLHAWLGEPCRSGRVRRPYRLQGRIRRPGGGQVAVGGQGLHRPGRRRHALPLQRVGGGRGVHPPSLRTRWKNTAMDCQRYSGCTAPQSIATMWKPASSQLA